MKAQNFQPRRQWKRRKRQMHAKKVSLLAFE
jgi:hypothetical protein